MLEVGSGAGADQVNGLPLVALQDELKEVITLMEVIYYAE